MFSMPLGWYPSESSINRRSPPDNPTERSPTAPCFPGVSPEQSSPTATSNTDILLAVPTEPRETSPIKSLGQGLGEIGAIDIQGASEWAPKPFDLRSALLFWLVAAVYGARSSFRRARMQRAGKAARANAREDKDRAEGRLAACLRLPTKPYNRDRLAIGRDGAQERGDTSETDQ
jgi:hypothetical protein